MTRIAQGYLTASKAPSQFVEGVYPRYAQSSMGVMLFAGNEDGNTKPYTDYVCGLGANLISIKNSFSLPSYYEEELAERLHEVIPFCEKFKFLKNGSDACSAAIRIARASNPNGHVVFGTGYHGWHNAFVEQEYPGAGCVPEGYIKHRDLEHLLHNLQDAQRGLAGAPVAVIIEPVQLDMGVKPLVQAIRDITTELGSVLIFDEVITGFRWPKYCAANDWGITPDLICLGKGLGDGYPISVLGGRADLMDNPDYFVSGTFFGDTYGLRSALQTLAYLSYSRLQALWDRGERFLERFNSLDNDVKIVGYPTRGELRGPDEKKALFMQEMVKRGYLFGRAWFITFSHTDAVLNKTLEAAWEVFHDIRRGLVILEGAIPRPIFKRN